MSKSNPEFHNMAKMFQDVRWSHVTRWCGWQTGVKRRFKNFQTPTDRQRKELSSKTIQAKLFMLTKETVLRQNSKQSTIKFSFVSTELIRLLTGLNDVSLIRIRKRKNEILTQSYLLFCVFSLQTFLCGNQEDLASSEAYVPRSSLHFRRSLRTFLWRTDLLDRN